MAIRTDVAAGDDGWDDWHDKLLPLQTKWIYFNLITILVTCNRQTPIQRN
jgi:hypothetical protein